MMSERRFVLVAEGMRVMSAQVIDRLRDTVGGDAKAFADDPHHYTAAQLRRLGVASVVYLRPCTVEGDVGCAILGADGALMGVVEDIDTAKKLASEQGMAVVTVH